MANDSGISAIDVFDDVDTILMTEPSTAAMFDSIDTDKIDFDAVFEATGLTKEDINAICESTEEDETSDDDDSDDDDLEDGEDPCGGCGDDDLEDVDTFYGITDKDMESEEDDFPDGEDEDSDGELGIEDGSTDPLDMAADNIIDAITVASILDDSDGELIDAVIGNDTI